MFKLAEQLHISNAESLAQQLKALLNSGEPVIVDASEVQKVDSASIQAICAMQKQLQSVGQHIEWAATSEAFCNTAKQLGLAEFLGFSVED